MDKYIWNRGNSENSSRIENGKGYLIGDYRHTDIDDLDRLFVDLENYFHQFYYVLTNIEMILNQLYLLSRIQAKKDFEKSMGLPISELKTLILKIKKTCREIKRAVYINDFDKLDVILRTYTYQRILLNKSLWCCAKYSQVVESAKYIRHRDKIDKFTELIIDFKIMSGKLIEILERLHGLIILVD